MGYNGFFARNFPTHLRDLLSGQLIATFVFSVTRMSFDPAPSEPMRPGQTVQFTPKVFVFHRLAIKRAPTAQFPISQPRRHPAFEIRRIGENFDVARLGQGAQGADCSLKFHAIVGGERFAAAYFYGVCGEI